MGKTGAGTGEELGVQDEIDLYFGTFAKSMAGIGGFIAGDKYMINYLMYNMRSQVYAKSLPMPMVIGAIKRLELIRTQPQHKQKLWDNVKMLQSGLKENGFDLGDTESAVTPVILKGGIPEAIWVATDLRENYDIFCTIVIYPIVPKGVILLRLIPTAIHTKEDIEYTIKAFSEVQKKLNNKEYDLENIPDVAKYTSS